MSTSKFLAFEASSDAVRFLLNRKDLTQEERIRIQQALDILIEVLVDAHKETN